MLLQKENDGLLVLPSLDHMTANMRAGLTIQATFFFLVTPEATPLTYGSITKSQSSEPHYTIPFTRNQYK